MKNLISHAGTVVDVADGCIRVRISQQSACSACKVSAACHASERKEKIVDVYGADAREYQKGDSVVVSTDGNVGRKAVILAYGMPVVLLMTAVVLGKWLTGDDAVGALAGLGVLVPYFIGLYLMRDRLRSIISFTIKQQT